MKNFYCLYQSYAEITPQVEEQHDGCTITPQVEEQIKFDVFSIPWGHHKVLIDKCKNNPQKALFFVHQTVVNGWSRNESSTQPIGISEYDLEKFYPEKVEGTIPTIEEIESKLNIMTSKK